MVRDSIYILSELESGVESAYKLLGHFELCYRPPLTNNYYTFGCYFTGLNITTWDVAVVSMVTLNVSKRV